MKIRPSILIRREDRALFLKYDYPEGFLFAIPGGGVEEGETLTQTLERELMEELGVEISVGRLAWVCEKEATGAVPKTLHLVFLGSMNEAQEPRLNPEHTSAKEFVWLDLNELEGRLIYPNLVDVLGQEQELLPKNPYLGLCPDRKWA